MMIYDLEIKGFKCFLDSKISFSNITILAGVNSAGKSSVIQMLLLLRQSYEKIMSNGCNINDLKNMKIALNDVFCLNLSNSSEILNVNQDDDMIKVKLNEMVEFTFKSSEDRNLNIELESISGIVNLKDSMSLFQKEFHYINTERISPKPIQHMKSMQYINTGYHGEYTGQALVNNDKKSVYLKKRIQGERSNIEGLTNQTEYWLDYILPDTKLRAELLEQLNIVTLGLCRGSIGTDFLNPNNLGFGVSYVLPIIVSGLIAEFGSILIVENPEAHLHPSAQTRIGEFLAVIASSGIQVILETHSEHVINGVRISSLKEDNFLSTEDIIINFFTINQTRGESEVHKILLNENAEMSEWPKDFLEQEQVDLRELARLRRIRMSRHGNK